MANAGVLISLDGRKILIDAPIRDGIPPYPTSSPQERALLEQARSPYDRISAILTTHWHEDHFDAKAVGAHLTRSSGTRLISSAEIIERVRSTLPSVPAARVVAVTPAAGASVAVPIDGGIRVHVLRIRHNDARRMPEQHVGFLIQGTRTVLHVGDADPTPANFALLKKLPKVDLALLPYWFVLNAKNREFVAASIAPERIVGMHLPVEEAAKVERGLRAAGANVILLTRPGTLVANAGVD